MHTSPEPMPHKEPLRKRESKAASNFKKNEARPWRTKQRKRRVKNKIISRREKSSYKYAGLRPPEEPAFPKMK